MHDVQALIARSEVLEECVRNLNNAVLCSLAQGFSLVPITTELANELKTRESPAAVTPLEEISGALLALAQEISSRTPVAYLTTCYYGGDGGQDAVVWKEGKIVFSPSSPQYAGSWPNAPISKALRLIGVVAETEKDEYDSVGFGNHRSTDRWAASVNDTDA